MEESIKILGDLVDEFPANPDYAYELSLTYAEPRRRSRRGGGPRQPRQTSKGYLTAAIALDRELVSHYPGVPRYKVLLAQHQARLGDLLLDQQDTAGAEASYTAAATALESLARASSVPSYGFFLSEAKYALGSLKLRGEAFQEARVLIGEAAQNLERSVKKRPDDRYIVRLATEMYEDLAVTLRHLDEGTLADAADAKAEEWQGKWRKHRDRKGFRRGDRWRGQRRGQHRSPRSR